METPIREFIRNLEGKVKIPNNLKRALILREKEVITNSYLKALTDTNFDDIVGIECCKEDAERYYYKTFNK